MFPDPEVFLLITIGTKIIIIIINAFRETDEEATNPTRHCPYVEPHSCAAAKIMRRFAVNSIPKTCAQ